MYIIHFFKFAITHFKNDYSLNEQKLIKKTKTGHNLIAQIIY